MHRGGASPFMSDLTVILSLMLSGLHQKKM